MQSTPPTTSPTDPDAPLDFSEDTTLQVKDPQRHQLPESWKLLPPLSPWTYYRRNVWRVLPVAAAIMLSVFLIAAIVTLLNSIDASIRVNYGFLSRVCAIAPQLETDVPENVLEKARQIPNISHVVKGVPYFVPLQTLFGEMPVPVYGIEQGDMQRMIKATGNHLAQGRLPRLNEPEIVLSRTWANNFGVHVGDTYTFKSERSATMTQTQRIVGILEGGENFAITDKTYLVLTLPEGVQRIFYILLPKHQQDLPSLSQHLLEITQKPQSLGLKPDDVVSLRVFTFDSLVDDLRRGLRFLYTFLGIADILVIGAVALLSGFLANIYFEQRLGEFGLLSALGFRRERLAKRLVLESGIMVALAWLLGISLTALFINGLDHFYMQPHGLIVSKIGLDAILVTLPTPLFVGVASLGTVLLRLYKLDPIEIMERR